MFPDDPDFFSYEVPPGERVVVSATYGSAIVLLSQDGSPLATSAGEPPDAQWTNDGPTAASVVIGATTDRPCVPYELLVDLEPVP